MSRILTPKESAAVQAIIAREDKAARAEGLSEADVKARCIAAATEHIMTLPERDEP